jgi:YbbR domain-containing protein
MNEFLKDMVFYKVICLFGAIYLFYRVGSFVVQVTRNLAGNSKMHAKSPLSGQ